jgi:hypothetical protein
MVGLTLALVLASSPFPLPSVGGKPLAITKEQRVFRLPMRFEKVRAFYQEQLGGKAKEGLKLTVTGEAGQRTLVLVSKRTGDAWTKAVVKEGETETVVEVTPVLRLDDEQIEGNGRPLVQFVFGRSKEVGHALDTIDHTDTVRSP